VRRSLLCLFLLMAALALSALAACGGDDGGESSSPPPSTKQTQTKDEPSPAALREALKDTSTKPVLPKPTGSPPRRLVTEDVVKGKGPPAKPGDAVTVNYLGVAFSTGEDFDNSWDRGQPIKLRLGAGQVIKGWDKGLVGMREGGRRILTIPPELAYGRQGYPPAIAPNETLVFVIDMVKITPRS
jgi:peptidylprolyl isomerase